MTEINNVAGVLTQQGMLASDRIPYGHWFRSWLLH